MNTIREIQRLNEQELERGLAGTSASWHDQYKNSAWVYVGNLDTALSEGDVLAVLSQFGEVDNLHLVRNEETGQSQGFGFVKYHDARSCVLAVDNLCGIELVGRSLRVDHVENYRLPKHLMEKEQEQAAAAAAAKLAPGHAYESQELANEYSLERGQDLFAPPPASASAQDVIKEDEEDKKRRKEAKRKRKKELREEKRREKKKKRRKERDRTSSRHGRGDEEERKRRKQSRRDDDGNSRKQHDSGNSEEKDHHRHVTTNDDSRER